MTNIFEQNFQTLSKNDQILNQAIDQLMKENNILDEEDKALHGRIDQLRKDFDNRNWSIHNRITTQHARFVDVLGRVNTLEQKVKGYGWISFGFAVVLLAEGFAFLEASGHLELAIQSVVRLFNGGF